ncbi:MAG: N-acetylmuramoyl-L-alanine amidase [Longicatena sp.]
MKNLKKKKYILGIAILCTLLFGSFFMTRVTSVTALKRVQNLAGIVIVLDSGHGGIDAGAKSGKYKEDEINLSIAKKTKALLEQSGAKVIMTRDGDYDLASKDAKIRKKEDMKKRISIINDKDVDLFLSIHLNAYPNTNVKGAQAFYQKDNEVARAFAQIMQKHLKTLTGTQMTCKEGDYYILNNAKKIGSLIECGFLSNAQDRSLLIQEEYQQKVAKTLYNGISEYFNFLT